MGQRYVVDRAQRWDGYQLVVFDFDGTLCLGDDPVLTYAQLVDDALAERIVSGNGEDNHRSCKRFSVRERCAARVRCRGPEGPGNPV